MGVQHTLLLIFSFSHLAPRFLFFFLYFDFFPPRTESGINSFPSFLIKSKKSKNHGQHFRNKIVASSGSGQLFKAFGLIDTTTTKGPKTSEHKAIHGFAPTIGQSSNFLRVDRRDWKDNERKNDD